MMSVCVCVCVCVCVLHACTCVCVCVCVCERERTSSVERLSVVDYTKLWALKISGARVPLCGVLLCCAAADVSNWYL